MRCVISRRLLSSSLAGLLAAGLSAPAFAQQQARTGGDNQQRTGQDQRYQSDQRQQQEGRSQQQDRDHQQDRQRQQDRDRQQFGAGQFGAGQSDRQQAGGQQQYEQQYRQDDRRDQQRGGDAQARLQPQGWIRIAVDTNNDGQFDTVENIFMFDLQEAQQKSRQRQQLGQGRFGRDDDAQQMQDQRRGFATRQDNRQRQQQTEDIRGTVEELRTTWLPERDGRFVVARVRTQDGRSEQVLLGSRNEIRKLDLDRGDRISVSGRRGDVNEETMVIAREVESDGRTVRPESEGESFTQRERQRYAQQDRSQRDQDPSTQRFYGQDRDRQDQERSQRDQYRETQRAQQASAQQDRASQGRVQQARAQQERARQDRDQQARQDGSSREIQGEVVSTQMMRVPDEEELQLVGNVRMENGEQMRVHFGPRSKFEDVELQAGTKVKIKARHGQVGNTQAWVAEEVELKDEDETITVDI
jgi:hypothetical protein